ncbi:hypothetical protein DVH05_024870 [Phytophthora capsici]|nr:hypothetical protein DVH05_024870 [Phytophthora capsici]
MRPTPQASVNATPPRGSPPSGTLGSSCRTPTLPPSARRSPKGRAERALGVLTVPERSPRARWSPYLQHRTGVQGYDRSHNEGHEDVYTTGWTTTTSDRKVPKHLKAKMSHPLRHKRL